MRGSTWLADQVAEVSAWLEQVIAELQVEVDEMMEEQKANGGWKGKFAGAVDYIADDLLGLW